MRKFAHIVLSIYIHHEYFPPTLHAISNLARFADSVTVITRNIADPNWEFPDNVVVKVSGSKMTLEQSMKQPYKDKVKSFLQYSLLLRRSILEVKPEMVVLHDPLALLAHYVVAGVRRIKYKLWYHNHDVIEPGKKKRFSLVWLAEKLQSSAFKEIDIFTLPTPDRRKYFPEIYNSAIYHTLNNYPSRAIADKAYYEKQAPGKIVKLLYQGVIRPGHGLEEIISMLNQNILGRNISLTIIGNIELAYKQYLTQLAVTESVQEQLTFLDRIAYQELPFETCKYDIGLAIHNLGSIQYATGGAASNKIYEYAAVGLPVILFDNEQYNKYLGKYSWASFTDLSHDSLVDCIYHILHDFEKLSKQANEDFTSALNYESSFERFITELEL